LIVRFEFFSYRVRILNLTEHQGFGSRFEQFDPSLLNISNNYQFILTRLIVVWYIYDAILPPLSTTWKVCNLCTRNIFYFRDLSILQCISSWLLLAFWTKENWFSVNYNMHFIIKRIIIIVIIVICSVEICQNKTHNRVYYTELGRL